MPTLVATIGSADANTYTTADEAATYFQSRLGGDNWSADDADKTAQALLTAMRILESLPFIGQRVNITQALQWPRLPVRPQERGRGMSWPYGGYAQGALFDGRGRMWATTVIPQPIKDAQCEIALALIEDPYALDLGDDSGNVSFAAGSVSIRERDSAIQRITVAAIGVINEFLVSGQQMSRA